MWDETNNVKGCQKFDSGKSAETVSQMKANPEAPPSATRADSIAETPAQVEEELITSSPNPNKAKSGRRFQLVAGPLAWLWLLAFCAGTGLAAVLWLTSLPPLPNCKRPQTLGLDAEKLFCAEQAARSGSQDSLLAGLDLVRGCLRIIPFTVGRRNWRMNGLSLCLS